MVQYKEYIDNHDSGSKRVLNAIESTLILMERHCWYLDETLVPLALLNPHFPDVDQENIAKTFSKPVPDQFQHSAKSNLFKDLHFKQETRPGQEVVWKLLTTTLKGL